MTDEQMVRQAIGMIVPERELRVADLQRKFRIGYVRAVELLDQVKQHVNVSTTDKPGDPAPVTDLRECLRRAHEKISEVKTEPTPQVVFPYWRFMDLLDYVDGLVVMKDTLLEALEGAQRAIRTGLMERGLEEKIESAIAAAKRYRK